MSLRKDLREVAALKGMFEKLRKQPTNGDPLKEAVKSVGEIFIRTQMDRVGRRISRHEREGRKECKQRPQ
jgi:hypothetical protein